MYEVIYMKAEYEPWWMFEGWEAFIEERVQFTSINEAKDHLLHQLQTFSRKYPHVEHKKDAFWAFWTDEEIEFCEACDDDLQTFHGILFMKNGVPYGPEVNTNFLSQN